MGHPADDQRILAEIEHGLARDDPVLVAVIDKLNQQFPEQSPPPPTNEPAPRRDRRIVVVVVLGILALVALLITAALNTSPPPADEQGVYPAAHSVATSVHRTP